MVQTTIAVQGMACSMCEAHINDAVRKAFSVTKVRSSRRKGETVIVSEDALDLERLKQVIDETGYRAGEARQEPYVKKGLFG